jgi:hypothetical protein
VNRSRLKRLIGVSVGTALVAGSLAVVASPAYADTLSATITPPTGANTTFATFNLSNGCPLPATTSYAGVIEGGAFPASGQLIVNPGTVGLSDTAFSVGASITFQDAAADAGFSTLSGPYTVRILCQDDFGNVQRDFTAPLTFTSPTTYTTPTPIQDTTTVLAVTPAGPVTVGTSVTVKATVSPAAAAGSVQFKDGAASLGAPVAVAAGVASLSTTALAAGTHSLTAVFTPGDPTAFKASTSAVVSLVVNSANGGPTTTTLKVIPPGPVPAFLPVLLAATVSPSAATGSVQFKDGGADLGAPIKVNNGRAIKVVANLAPGTHSLTATFVPDSADYLGSTSDPVALVVKRRPTKIDLTVNDRTIKRGDQLELKADVDPNWVDGKVQFKDGTRNIGAPVTVAHGRASLKVNNLAVGTHSLTAVFTPDNAWIEPSTSAAVTVTVRR